MLAELNAAVGRVASLPRVQFEPGLGIAADSWLIRKHADGGVHEPATVAAFLAIHDRYKSRTIFDVGAYYGYFAKLCRQQFPEAEVTAFEVHPSFIGPLARNLPDVTCIHAAVSDVSRKDVEVWLSAFNIYEEPDGGWLKLPPEAMKPRGANASGFSTVDFTTLDEYCESGVTPPDLIKIDVEGYQTKAVLGCRNLLGTTKPAIIIELHDPDKLARFGTTNAETVKPILDAGYQGFWSGNHRSMNATFEPIDRMGPEHERLSLAVFVP